MRKCASVSAQRNPTRSKSDGRLNSSGGCQAAAPSCYPHLLDFPTRRREALAFTPTNAHSSLRVFCVCLCARIDEEDDATLPHHPFSLSLSLSLVRLDATIVSRSAPLPLPRSSSAHLLRHLSSSPTSSSSSSTTTSPSSFSSSFSFVSCTGDGKISREAVASDLRETRLRERLAYTYMYVREYV